MSKTISYIKLTLRLFAISFLITVLGVNIFTTTAFTAINKEPIVSSTGASITLEEQLALELLNADRAANGLAALKLNLAVTVVAQRHAQDEINRDFFAHNNPDGLSPFDRMHEAGISFHCAGENLAINQNITSAEKSLMNSPGHRANILSSDYTEVGIGIRHNPQGTIYVVQCFIGR